MSTTNSDMEQQQDPPPLHGRWLRLARVVWIAIALLALTLLLIGAPIYFHQLQTVDGCRLCGDQRLTLERLHGLQTLGLSGRVYAAYFVTVEMAHVLVYWTVAAAIFWRKSDDRLALLGAFMLLLLGAGFTTTLSVPASIYPIFWLSASLNWVGALCFLLFFCLFPNGRFVPRWTRGLVVGWGIYMAFHIFTPDFVDRLGVLFGLLPWISFLGAIIGVQIYRYRRISNVRQRQQTKWVVFGMTAALGGVVALNILDLVLSQWLPGGQGVALVSEVIGLTGIHTCMMLIPLSIGMAILRARLWDIDIIIRKTLVYSTLTAILALVYYGSVMLLQSLVFPAAGEQTPLVIVLSTLAIAALFHPLRQRIQNVIDRRFYRRKYNARQMLDRFALTARDEVDLEKIEADLLSLVDEALQPEQVSLWLRTPSSDR